MKDKLLERLRIREVKAVLCHTASSFLADFQTTAASLDPDKGIELNLDKARRETCLELAQAVLSNAQASKICSLRWEYDGEEDVNAIIPLLINNCPELTSLEVRFGYLSSFDFLSNVLEHPDIKVKALILRQSAVEGDFPRFFATLGRSQVSAITVVDLYSPDFYQGLYEYLARDLLVRLEVSLNRGQVPLDMVTSLAKCTRLVELQFSYCEFFQSTTLSVLPKSISKLTLDDCTFVGQGQDWSFLVKGSGMQELNFFSVEGVDGNQFGDALSVHLRAKGLNELCLCDCGVADETLAVVGAELGRIKRLEIAGNLDDASIELISLVLQSPDSALRELRLRYYEDTTSSIENHLMLALKHPNCNLTKLSFRAYEPEHEEAAERMEDMFYNRLALFVLLQGRQVRRLYCPLRRLPVEMFRLVGEVLI